MTTLRKMSSAEKARRDESLGQTWAPAIARSEGLARWQTGSWSTSRLSASEYPLLRAPVDSRTDITSEATVCMADGQHLDEVGRQVGALRSPTVKQYSRAVSSSDRKSS